MEEPSEYDPNLLSDPQWPCGRHKRVLIFASYMVSFLPEVPRWVQVTVSVFDVAFYVWTASECGAVACLSVSEAVWAAGRVDGLNLRVRVVVVTGQWVCPLRQP